MKTLHTIAAAAALIAGGISPALAQGTTFQNGAFNGNSLANWTTAGDVVITGPRSVVALTTASVDYDDDVMSSPGFNNRSGTAAVDFYVAPDLAGISFANLDATAGNSTFEGSAIRQDFIANAGDILTVKFDWTFLSADKNYADFGFLAVNNTIVKFADAFSAPAASSFNGTFGDFNNVNWGWANATYTYTASATGAVSFALGVVDVGDSSYTSELRVDNITVSAVPEPESYLMLLAGLGLMGSIARRRILS